MKKIEFMKQEALRRFKMRRCDSKDVVLVEFEDGEFRDIRFLENLTHAALIELCHTEAFNLNKKPLSKNDAEKIAAKRMFSFYDSLIQDGEFDLFLVKKEKITRLAVNDSYESFKRKLTKEVVRLWFEIRMEVFELTKRIHSYGFYDSIISALRERGPIRI